MEDEQGRDGDDGTLTALPAMSSAPPLRPPSSTSSSARHFFRSQRPALKTDLSLAATSSSSSSSPSPSRGASPTSPVAAGKAHASRVWLRNAFESLRRPRTPGAAGVSGGGRSAGASLAPQMGVGQKRSATQLRPKSSRDKEKEKDEKRQQDKDEKKVVIIQPPSPDKVEPMRDSAMMDSENQAGSEDSKRATATESLPTIVVDEEEEQKDLETAKEQPIATAESQTEASQTAEDRMVEAQTEQDQTEKSQSSQNPSEESQIEQSETKQSPLEQSQTENIQNEESQTAGATSTSAVEAPSEAPESNQSKTGDAAAEKPWNDSTTEGTADSTKVFRPISTTIPTGSFDDLTNSENIQFSTRGSLMLLGQKANFGNLGGMSSRAVREHMDALKLIDEEKPTHSSNMASLRKVEQRNITMPRNGIMPMRMLTAEEVLLSKRVRYMYEHGDERAAEFAVMEDIEESPVLGSSGDVIITDPEGSSTRALSPQMWSDRPMSPDTLRYTTGGASSRMSSYAKEPLELAGGMEDWDNVRGADVDRYGFIVPRRPGSRDSSSGSFFNSDRPHMQRVSTSLQVASETPRRNKTLRRVNSLSRSMRSTGKSLKAASLKPAASLYSYRSGTSFASATSSFRLAANRLPQFRDRRRVFEAGDMLTLPPGLADIAEAKEGGRLALEQKKKEWEREDKWRTMGRVSGQRSGVGGGMVFDFDARDPKVISRTWKGIPDRWRAVAWWSFLEASARKATTGAGDETADTLVDAFYRLQDEASADDVQIDVDVPRTISAHIMFRRRYRGGQRLLFRVLHALSLHLPETGYVQGMAALAATLLCYYDEEKAFVMLVRLFKLRGLEKLYQSGFGGLMEALEDFEMNWLNGSDVAAKLNDLGITSTAYGTRWYLTLFNYSLPFAAQLRVWDVFMLLGDISNAVHPNGAQSESAISFGADLDVLHSTSMALIDATREILLDSDFENAMKVLTSWVPVKDEEMLMRVVKVEWRARKKRGDRTPNEK